MFNAGKKGAMQKTESNAKRSSLIVILKQMFAAFLCILFV